MLHKPRTRMRARNKEISVEVIYQLPEKNLIRFTFYRKIRALRGRGTRLHRKLRKS